MLFSPMSARMSAEKYETDLKQFMFESFPCIPFTAKKNAKKFFDQLSIFRPDSKLDWIDSQPTSVLNAFILFFTKKNLEGIAFKGTSELIDGRTSLKERVKTFIEENRSDLSVEPVQSDQISKVADAQPKEDHVGQEAKRAKVKERKLLLAVLVGLPGSGKTTFSHRLIEALKDDENQVVRFSQDETSRDQCERDAHFHLSEEDSVNRILIVDRTNFNADQRSTWLKIAQRYRCPAVAVEFDVDPSRCTQRATSRQNHPTLQAKDAAKVVNSLAKAYRPPTMSEGFEALFTTNTEDIDTVIQQLKEFYRAL